MTDQTRGQTLHQPTESDREAADWLIRLTEIASDSEDAAVSRQKIQDDFNLWATRSPDNLRSFLEIASIFAALGECEAELIHELVAHIDSAGNVASLVPAGSQPATAESTTQIAELKERTRKSWRPAGAVAATLAVMAAGGALLGYSMGGTTYRTQAGEWRRVRFEDGSVAFLGEQSEIRVSYSSASRRIDLHRGQTVFDVVQDPRRPFFVATPNAEIQALGTRFDVDYRNGPTRVTVVDGSVRVRTATDTFQPDHMRTLNGEEGAEVSARKIVESDRLQVENTVASQRDVLMFDHQRLSVVAARINFNSRKQLRFADPAAGQKSISGRYMTDHPEGLVLAIQELYPDLSVRETDDGWLVAERAPAAGSAR